MSCSLEQRRSWIEAKHQRLSVARQCALLGLDRSSYYCVAEPEATENLRYRRLLDEEYTRHPFYGVEKMTFWLRQQAYAMGPKRVRRLLRQMGLMAVYPKPHLSLNSLEHRRFPYLLRGLRIERPNQVWSSDITYIRLRSGFVYLVAILDWYSRYVLAWELSISLEGEFCRAALEWALARERREIFSTDQGVQFTSREFQAPLLAAQVRLSMDGRGRLFDNIVVERLWRSVKYEEVYLKDSEDVRAARRGLRDYFHFYNTERYHQALEYRTPQSVHWGGS
jgi:putative transposase